MNALLITGTDAGVGKTVVTAALAAYWSRYCHNRSFALLKPIQCGGGDRELYSRLFHLPQSLDEINPVYFESDLLPPLAALQANRRIRLDSLWATFNALLQTREFVFVEGVGSLGTPITPETCFADLVWDWRLPAVLVVPVRPGAIAHAVASVALAQRSRVHIKGIILNCIQPCSEDEIANHLPPSIVRSLTQLPILGCIPHLANPEDLDQLAQAASQLDLDYLLPGMAIATPS